MSYNYAAEKPKLFTDEGQRAVMSASINAHKLIDSAGAFMAFKCLVDVKYDDTFMAMAILDRLVELRVIREVTGPGAWGQHRVFAAAFE